MRDGTPFAGRVIPGCARYHGILLLLEGKSCPEIAPWVSRGEETLRRWVHAFHTAGLPGLEREASPGRPA
jgi:transposase